ncbi:MAG: hypothetical protein Q4E13_11390 [Clostridia bacterium]|nr:hypothetical protein [Clostridia bacterium]
MIRFDLVFINFSLPRQIPSNAPLYIATVLSPIPVLLEGRSALRRNHYNILHVMASYDAIADEIFRLQEQKEQSEVDSHHREEIMNRIKELQDFITKQKTAITEVDEALVKKLIEKITVFADHFTVEFKSGITIEIEA